MKRKKTLAAMGILKSRACIWAAVGLLGPVAQNTRAQSNLPALLNTNLVLATVVTNLDTPTTIAFLGRNDFFVLEKASGQVKRVQDETNVTTVLDLPVNSASERGLLGIALHPRFQSGSVHHTLQSFSWTQDVEYRSLFRGSLRIDTAS